MSIYTIFAKFPNGDVEELDVRARDAQHARAAARKELAKDYEPGGKIVRVVGPRVGLFA